jgi:hypothetical protein
MGTWHGSGGGFHGHLHFILAKHAWPAEVLASVDRADLDIGGGELAIRRTAGRRHQGRDYFDRDKVSKDGLVFQGQRHLEALTAGRTRQLAPGSLVRLLQHRSAPGTREADHGGLQSRRRLRC